MPDLDSRCRKSRNLLSFYLTEQNGLSVIVKMIIVGIFFKLYLDNNLDNKIIIGLLSIMVIQIVIHLIMIIMSLPSFCDSSNLDWLPEEGSIFSFPICHKKYEIYYSNTFWFFDTIYPLLVFIITLYFIYNEEL